MPVSMSTKPVHIASAPSTTDNHKSDRNWVKPSHAIEATSVMLVHNSEKKVAIPSQISTAFALTTSQFLYSAMPPAISPVMPITIHPIGPDNTAKIDPKLLNTSTIVPIVKIRVPKAPRIGPITATIPPIITMNFFVPSLRLENFSIHG